MKYKVGDKARVKSDLVLYGKTYGGLSFTTAMSEFKGKTVTIKLVLRNKYRLVEDTGEFAWSDEMFEDVEEEFKLPEKWCIKSTKENIESLGKYWDDGCRVGKLYSRKEMFPYWIGQYWCSYNLASGNLLFSEEPGSNHMIYSKPEKLLEITFDQFKKYVLKESESTTVKEEVKFEVGKWYKNLGIDECYYGKLSDTLGEGRFPCKEFISPNGTYYDNGSFFSDFKFATECNLSEIQQYLPESHPDKIKRKTKKAEDLKYPDVVHCSSKEQHDKINSFAGLMGYDGDKWYLTGSYGRASKPYDEAGGKGYTNYEFSDIIFPEEKVIDKEDEEFKVGAYIVFIDSFGGSKKGDIDKIRRVDSAEQILLVKEGLSWGRLAEKFSKICRYFLTLKEAQAFSDELLGKNKVETKPILSKEELLVEAKRRYPVGTKFKSPENGEIYEVNTRHRTWEGFDEGNILISIGNNCGEFVFYNGRWAEIVEETQKEEIPEYVECIGLNEHDAILWRDNYEIGGIYKLNKIYAGGNYEIIGKSGKRCCYKSQFKPSTKEAFDKQQQRSKQLERPISQKEEKLVQTDMCQDDACESCKYWDNCLSKGFRCKATGGQHYPKDYIPGNRTEGYMDGVNIPDSDEIYVPIIKTEVKQIKL